MPRTLPFNQDAERHVIGACLMHKAALEDCLQVLHPEHFYLQAHQIVFAAMRDLRARNEPVDTITIHRELEATHALRPLATPWEGGEPASLDKMRVELATILAETPTFSNAKRHALIVREMWGKRHLIERFTPPMQGVWNGASPSSVLRDVEKALIEARQQIEDDDASRVIATQDAAQWLQDYVATPTDRMAGVAAPFRFLPRFQPERLYVLGGYPKDGKTAISVQFLAAAAREGKRVGYVSIEMSWQDLAMRIASTYGVPYLGLQDGFVGEPYRRAFENALEDMSRWQVEVIDDAAVTASDIARYQRLGRYDYLIIDYLQRIPYADRLELNREIKTITTLARTSKIPILLLSQFSRPATGGFPKPTMSSFAETSMIEKEASLAMAVWRPRDEFGEPGGTAKFIRLANRYGPVGINDLWFDGEQVRFTELAR